MMIYQVVPVASAPDSLTAVCPEEKRRYQVVQELSQYKQTNRHTHTTENNATFAVAWQLSISC